MMNKKIQLIFTAMITFTSISVASEEDDYAKVSPEIAADMQRQSGNKETSFYENTWVLKKDLQDYQQGKLGKKPLTTISSQSKDFPVSKIDSNQKWVDVPKDTYRDMQKGIKPDDKPISARFYGHNPEAGEAPSEYIGVLEEDFQKYSEEKRKKGERIPLKVESAGSREE